MFGVPPLGGYAATALDRVNAELQTKLRLRQFQSCLRSFERTQDCLRHNKCLSASNFFPEGDVHRKCCAIASATNFLARLIASSSARPDARPAEIAAEWVQPVPCVATPKAFGAENS